MVGLPNRLYAICAFFLFFKGIGGRRRPNNAMTIVIIAIHVIVCLALILIVLLQTGKGADMGAAFGMGSSQTLFGSAGSGGFMSKATTAAAVIFMITSLALGYLSSHHTSGSSIMENAAPKAAQEQTAAPAPEAPATTSESQTDTKE
jgi:preprotein translocase subunit SecG